ncbi:MAG TPA: hypothetical protein PLY35_09440 [Thermotogota bacterium]|nr:hypothetical protein [Thermotogota bacterium]
MIKIKTIINEALNNRNIFIIAPDGKLYNDINYHGEIVFKFKSLEDAALKLFKTKSNILSAAKGGNTKLIDLILDADFIIGGIFSQSKRQLYVTWSTPTKSAILGLIKKLSEYKPTEIYFEDHKHPNRDGMYDTSDFIDNFI